MKYLLLALVVIWLLFSPTLRRKRQLKRERRQSPPPRSAQPSQSPQVEEMVACAHCGIHLPASDALRDAAQHPYCCAAHRDAGKASH